MCIAILKIRKFHQTLDSKIDDPYKRLKINPQDILRLLRRIFENRVDDYEKLGGNLIHTRIKDYIVDILPSTYMEPSALDFLEITRREALLVIKHKNRDPEYLRRQEAQRRQEEDYLLSTINRKAKPQDFYGMNDLMGPQEIRLPRGYIQQVKDYQKVKQVTGEQGARKKQKGGMDYDLINNEEVYNYDEQTFEEIYDSISDKQMDRELVDYIKATKAIEEKANQLSIECEMYPEQIAKLEQSKEKIKKEIIKREEQILFVQQIISKIQLHETHKNVESSLIQPSFLEHLEDMSFYYKNYATELNTLVFGGKTVDRYPVTEYFKSSVNSDFQASKNRYDMDEYEDDVVDELPANSFQNTRNFNNFAMNSHIYFQQ